MWANLAKHGLRTEINWQELSRKQRYFVLGATALFFCAFFWAGSLLFAASPGDGGPPDGTEEDSGEEFADGRAGRNDAYSSAKSQANSKYGSVRSHIPIGTVEGQDSSLADPFTAAHETRDMQQAAQKAAEQVPAEQKSSPVPAPPPAVPPPAPKPAAAAEPPRLVGLIHGTREVALIAYGGATFPLAAGEHHGTLTAISVTANGTVLADDGGKRYSLHLP